MNRPINTLLLFLFTLTGFTQQSNPPFFNDIVAFKKQDNIQAPPKDAILFIGSSSFTMWKDIQTYFPEIPIINRGFGGSSLTDQIRYVNDIVFPYQPKQIVIYCGENDLAASDTVSAQTVADRFKTLFEMIRKRMPQVYIMFITIKPSPSRARLMPKMKAANDLIRYYLAYYPRTTIVDVYSLMLTEEGRPRPELFLADSLHMNASGYELWKKAIERHLAIKPVPKEEKK